MISSNGFYQSVGLGFGGCGAALHGQSGAGIRVGDRAGESLIDESRRGRAASSWQTTVAVWR
jgi:hypothetical protein